MAQSKLSKKVYEVFVRKENGKPRALIMCHVEREAHQEAKQLRATGAVAFVRSRTVYQR